MHTEGKVIIVLQSFLNIHFSSSVLNELITNNQKTIFEITFFFCSFLLNWSLYSIHFVIGHSTSRCANYIYDRIKEIFKFENVNIVSIKKYIPLHPVLWSQWSCKQYHLFWQNCLKAGYLHLNEQFKPMYPNGQTKINKCINNKTTSVHNLRYWDFIKYTYNCT